jgi:hypothetical protein
LLGVRKNAKKWLGKKSATVSKMPAPTVFKSSSDSSTKRRRSRLQTLKDFVYDLCYFPDQAGPWLLPASRQGIDIVKKYNINAIFATGSPWSSLIVGYRISKATGVPLIVDFRDPWMNNPFHQSKGALLDSWSKKLEAKVVHHASAVSLNTEPLLQEFLGRYPNQAPDKFFVMPNGFDESDFQNLPQEAVSAEKKTITLCHAGFLYGVRDPATLLDAIRDTNQGFHNEGVPKRIVLRQIGDVQLDYDLKQRYKDLLADGSLIIEPPRPYLECLRALKAADLVVNIQPATRSQIPSKLYDYLAINRPILSITPADGALGRLVAEKNIGEQADFHELDKIRHILKDAAENTGQIFSGYSARREFNVAEITKILSRRIEQLI